MELSVENKEFIYKIKGADFEVIKDNLDVFDDGSLSLLELSKKKE